MNIFRKFWNWFNRNLVVEITAAPKKTGHMTVDEKVQIVYWHSIGLEVDEIVELSGRSIASVYRVIAAHKKG